MSNDDMLARKTESNPPPEGYEYWLPPGSTEPQLREVEPVEPEAAPEEAPVETPEQPEQAELPVEG